MNNTILQFTGQDAITVGLASNRQPELLNGDTWTTAHSLRQAVSVVKEDPNCVRLRIFARVVLEDLLHMAIDPEISDSAFKALTLSPESDELIGKALQLVGEAYAKQEAS